MGYAPTLRNPFSDTTLGAQPGSSGYVATSATARDECNIEMSQQFANVTEARRHDRHMTDSWKGDASAKAVLMFVSFFQLTGHNLLID